jgi:uncharacterized protein YpuA (DUF1002 family)
LIEDITDVLEEITETIGVDDDAVYCLLTEVEDALVSVAHDTGMDVSGVIKAVEYAMNVYEPDVSTDDARAEIREYVETAKEQLGFAQEQRGEYNGR